MKRSAGNILLYWLCILATLMAVSCRSSVDTCFELNLYELDCIDPVTSEVFALKGKCSESLFLRDSILCLSMFRSDSTEAMVSYDIISGEKLVSIPYGRSPEEMISVGMSAFDEVLTLHDFVKEALCFVDFNDTPPSLEYHMTTIQSQQVVKFGDRCVFLNQNSFWGKEPRLLLSDLEYNGYQPQAKWDTYNVVNGFIGKSMLYSRYCFADRHGAKLEIIEDSEVIRTVKFCNSLDVSYSDYKSGDYKVRTFKDYVPVSVVGFCFNDQHITILHDPYVQTSDTVHYLYNHATISIHDWDGNLVRAIVLPLGMHPESVYESSDGKSFLTVSQSSDSIVVYKHVI